MENFYDKFNIPSACKVDRVVFKKLFYDNEHINTKDKEIIKIDVQKVIWKYALKEDTIHIKPFTDEGLEYGEVAIIEVELAGGGKTAKLAEIMQREIPYPLILIFTFEGKVMVNVAEKRSHYIDQSKVTVETLFFTDWIDVENPTDKKLSFLEKLDIKTKNSTDFRKFYFDYIREIQKYNLGKYKRIEEGNLEDPEKLKENLKTIEGFEIEIGKLQKQMKLEKQLSKKVQLNVTLKKLKEEKAIQIEQL